MEILTYQKDLNKQKLDAAQLEKLKAAALLRPDAGQVSSKTAPAPPLPQTALLLDTLQLYGFKPTDENIQMLTKMLDAGIPLTQENIVYMNKAYKLTQNIEQALFLLQNDKPATPKNAALLNALTEGQIKITRQITALLDEVAQLKDPSIKQAVIKLLDNIGNLPGSPETGHLQIQERPLPADRPPNQETPLTPVKITNMPKAPAGIPLPLSGTLPVNSPLSANNTLLDVITQFSKPAQAQGAPLAPALMAHQTAADPPLAAPAQNAVSAYAAFEAAAGSKPSVSIGAFAQVQQVESSATHQSVVEHPPAVDRPPIADRLPAVDRPLIAGQQFASLQGEATQIITPDTPEVLRTTGNEPYVGSGLSAGSEQSALPDLQTKLSLPLQNIQNADSFINSLREILNQVLAELAAIEANNPAGLMDTGITRVRANIQTLIEYMDFTAQLRSQIFVQVPIIINEQIFNTALYVNKDQNSKKNKNTSTALIALDTAFLGHFETYIQKNGQAVSCQFRLENEETEQLVRANIHKLDNLLKEHRFMLESFTFLIGDRPFTLLDALEEEKYQLNRSDTVFDVMA